MANPTTNFGWVMPTSSSLVTNLPADFNTFGQAVDTSMSELLGGTTGQVLSKTSATNMDFTWVTPTDQTPLTTKGDIFAFSTVDARLPAGTNETRLVADSAQTLGLKYVADTTNYAIAAKGDLLAGTAADTLQALSVGTNGQTLVADSTASTGLKWATAASGALTKIQTSTFSAVANTNTTFDGVFTSTYRNYVIAFNNMFSSGSQQLLMQVRVSGTTRTSGYYGTYNVVPYNGSITTTGVNNGSEMQILNLQNSTGPAGLTMNARGGVSGTSSEPQFYATGYDVVSLGPLWCGFERTTGEVVTGFILSVASGTVSGTVTIYGVEN